MKKRSEIEEKYKWDITKFCKSDDDFYKRMKKLSSKMKEIKKFEGKLDDDDMLFECLEKSYAFEKEFGFLTLYSELSKRVDNADIKANVMCEKLTNLQTLYLTYSAYIEVEIASFSDEKLKALQKNKRFKNYSRLFNSIRRDKKHILSKKEELLISKLGNFLGGFTDNFDKFADVDLDFGEIEDKFKNKHPFNQSNFSVYAESDDRTLRKNAYKRMNGKFGEFINFISNNYASDVKEVCTFAKIRNYKSALAKKIYGEEASEKAYYMLLKKVRENIKILQDFYEIKRKALNLDRVAIYDTFAPISKMPKQKFTYEEAIELIKKALSVLGDDYVTLIDKAVKERWIDVYPNLNKDSGAFSWGCYGATPVVLCNFEGNLSSVFTLAHELGHAMHSYYSNTHQPIQTAGYVIFVAEVASITNEMLLLDYLLKNAKIDEEKKYYYDYFLTEVRSTIFRQTMFSEFEEWAHATYEKGEALTRESMCNKYKELNDFYHGDKVEQIDEMQYEWARIPHFYSHFYVYKYATGMISAINIARNILKKTEGAVEQYKKFLSSGSTASPITLLKRCGCDLESEEIYDDVFSYCKDYVKNMEKLV
ncbi:MAG TPA: oligoendopeptidase F [Candidatus Caccovivens faecavium]|nr:oligoendopeptidase F [Candidatus Caccovivens faecavium]